MSQSTEREPTHTAGPRDPASVTRPARALGRGLGALIPHGASGLLELELTRIRPNPEQPRLTFDPASLDELVESIRQHGVLQPVVVRRDEADGDSYILIAGERRWRAAQRAGRRTVPAVVKEVAPRGWLELALVENVQREDLTPLELAGAYRSLLDEHGLTQEQVAQRVGKSRASVANTVRLLGLPAAARAALADGRLSEGHARALLGAPDETALLSALAGVLADGLSVRQTEALLRRAATNSGSPAPAESAAPTDRSSATDLSYLEERLRQRLGTRVQLVHGKQGGRLIVHFYSDEELQALYEAICGSETLD